MPERIVVAGSSNVDFVMSMDHLPQYGETVTDAEFVQSYGGKGANQAVAVARAGGECTFLAAVGDDANAGPMVDSWDRAGLDVSRVFTCEGVPSGCALVMVDRDGGNYLSIAPGANYRLTPEVLEANRDLIAAARFLVLQYEIPVASISWLIDLARQHRVQTIWNFAPARSFPGAYTQQVDYLIVNEVEAGFLADSPVTTLAEASSCARSLQERGAGHVVVTLGPQGSVLASSGELVHIPAFPVTAVDTTAAGDVYCGALSVALSEGASFVEAGRFAAAASALCVTKLGAQPSAPSRAEIDAFLAERGGEALPVSAGG